MKNGLFLGNRVLQAGMLAMLLACSGGLAPGGGNTATGESPVTEVGSQGVGDPASVQASLSGEMPEIMVGPGFDGTTSPKGVKKKVLVRIPAEVSLACHNPEKSPATVTKHVKAKLECRWADSPEDPFTTCGRGRLLRIYDSVAKQYVDVKTDETDASFEFDFTFNLPVQSAAAIQTNDPTKNTPSSVTDATLSIYPQQDPSNAISDETDLSVYVLRYSGGEPNLQKPCSGLCVAFTIAVKLGIPTFPSDYEVIVPSANTETCEL